MIPAVGVFAVSVALLASLLSAGSFILFHRERESQLWQFATRSYYMMSAGIALSLILLISAIMSHDFQLNFVYSYSSRILNKFYLFATLWAGQEGTFLLWLFYGSLFGLILIKTSAKKNPLVMSVILSVQAFLLILLHIKNPFAMIWEVHTEVPAGFTPEDGAGLNPLLQNPWMVIHPPTLFVGYSSTIVPFAFAVAALFQRNLRDWIRPAKPWIIFNVMVLGTGLIMGGYWAYTTLGWGGYWGWDPVENASLVPWLCGIILLHGVLIQEKKGALMRTNTLLAGALFLTMVWGSFLTRSGVLTDFSVHSFGESGLNYYLVLFQALFTVLFLAAFWQFYVSDRKSIDRPGLGSKLLNRETFIWAGMTLILFTAIVVLIATSSPIYTGIFGPPTSVPPDFYNKIIVPIAALILVTVGIAPQLTWKRSGLRRPDLLWKISGASLVITLVGIALGLNEWRSILLFSLAIFVLLTNGRTAYLIAKRNFARAGGYLAHIGLALMVVGIITSSIYDSSEDVSLQQGELTDTGFGYALRYVDFIAEHDGRDKVRVEVLTENGDYEARPRFFFSDYANAYMVSPDVNVGVGKDIYISPVSYTPAEMAHHQHVELGKGQSTSFDSLVVTFHTFSVNMGAETQEVTANITAQFGDSASYELHPKIVASGGEMFADQVFIPGTDIEISIQSVNATDGTVTLSFAGLTDSGPTPRNTLVVEVSEKPLISVLWFGCIIFIGGIALTLLEKIRIRKRSPKLELNGFSKVEPKRKNEQVGVGV